MFNFYNEWQPLEIINRDKKMIKDIIETQGVDVILVKNMYLRNIIAPLVNETITEHLPIKIYPDIKNIILMYLM